MRLSVGEPQGEGNGLGGSFGIMNSFKINVFSDMKWIFSLFKVIYAGHSSAKFKKITAE
jgi:hypothetical protein